MTKVARRPQLCNFNSGILRLGGAGPERPSDAADFWRISTDRKNSCRQGFV